MTSHPHDRTLFLNRELSWLAFNERVLEEAADPSNPLLERVKFASIAASNLDEFFMVRVAGLKESVDEGQSAPDLCGMTPQEQLTAIGVRAHTFVENLYRLAVGELLPALAERGIRLAKIGELSEERQASLGAFFRDAVLPVLTPLAIDVLRPFPRLSSLSLNIAVLLEATSDDTRRRLAVVQVPTGLQRLVQVAGGDGATFVFLEDLIRLHLAQLFPGQRIVLASYEGGQLAWSDDHARSWTFADWRFAEFGLVGFVNFGRDYRGARDDFVYAYSHDGPRADTPADRFVLMRAPKDRLTRRAAWEFYAGTDGGGRPT